MIDFSDFFDHIEHTALKNYTPQLRTVLDARYTHRIHGDHALWQSGFDQLPELSSNARTINGSTVSASPEITLSEADKSQLTQALKTLHPWRKGPYQLFDLFIDTEWHSDWKWDRIAPHISPLGGRYVLDVGCGSGYHCWRMHGAGAKLVVGIDPSQKFLFQFHAIKKYLGQHPVFFLPFRSEDMPKNMQRFDTVFSLGVLYHRPSPFEHIDELRQTLKPGGELVLETLTVEGGENTVLVPPDRYAQMRNVWFLPSPATLCQWLNRAGFTDIKVVDTNQTTIEEQRSTDWMTFHSLEQFLDPNDSNKTVEGLPAPVRTTIVATKPLK